MLANCAKLNSSKGGKAELTEAEQLALIHARTEESVNNASVQALTGVHRADVTNLLTGLRKRGLLVQESSRRWAIYKLPGALRKMYKEKTIKKNDKEKPIMKKPISKTYKQKPISKNLLAKPTSKTHLQKPTSKPHLQKSAAKTERLKNRILVFCQLSRSAEEIAVETGKNRRYLADFYLTPMVKEGLLAYTNPDYPRARNQKYLARAARK